MSSRPTTLLRGSYLIWVSDDEHPPPHHGSIIWITRNQCRNWKDFIRTSIARRAQAYGCQVACPETTSAALRAECRTLRKQMYPSSDEKLAKIADHLKLNVIADELSSRPQHGHANFRDMIDILDRTPLSRRSDQHDHQRWLFLALDLL